MQATAAMPSGGSVGTSRPDLDRGFGGFGVAAFALAVLGGIAYVAYSIYIDAAAAHVHAIAILPFVLLFIALLIALGFEFVNGFHDTANAVATVIYTNSLPAHFAVVWSGLWNFLGVLTSAGTVAFTIVSLLPVELILQVGSQAGFAMVFALLIAAIIWNLATWYFGIPNSSSHTLIGSVIGVGVANAILNGRGGTAGVDWDQAMKIGKALLFSPLIGFGLAAALFLLLKLLVRAPSLYKEPQPGVPPPMWIRILLILTCTGVSFGHGSNDGQKGMGLIMLILIGTVPTAYALNRAVPAEYTAAFHQQAVMAAKALNDSPATMTPADARALIAKGISNKHIDESAKPALATLVSDIDRQVQEYGSLAAVPATATANVRNDMYLASEAIKQLEKGKSLSADQTTALDAYKGSLDKGTRFIPVWVKVAVAIALGLGTMIGWKRIVVTVGEKIGKSHMTYAQGASAEIVTAATIFGADALGVPVSTTHVLTSGVAGTMTANGAGLQASTIRSLVMAWVLTLPISIALAAVLYFILHAIF